MSEAQKYFFCFWLKVNFLFTWLHSQCSFNVARRSKNKRWKWQHCFNVVYRCSYQRWNRQRWIHVVKLCKSQRWHKQGCLSVDLRLCDVTTLCQSKNKVEATLKCLLRMFWKTSVDESNIHSKLLRYLTKTPWKINEKESIFCKVEGVNWWNFAKNIKKCFQSFLSQILLDTL